MSWSMWQEAAVIDVPSKLMGLPTKDTDPPRNVDEVTDWKLTLPLGLREARAQN